MQQQQWRTSVGELMHLFRNALLALIPHLEKARIAWRDEEAYDEWDQIAQALFEGMVVRSIQWGVASGEQLQFPAYAHLHRDYSRRSIIVVADGEPEARPRLAFLRFATQASPLDTVECLRMSDRGDILPDQSVRIPIDGARFRVWCREGGELRGSISDLAVEL